MVEALIEAGLTQSAGHAAFEKRNEAKPAVYAYERRDKGLSAEYEQKLKVNHNARAFFLAQPYGWPRDGSDGEVLARLLRLNGERAGKGI